MQRLRVPGSWVAHAQPARLNRMVRCIRAREHRVAETGPLAQAACVLQALPGCLERMSLACRRNASAEATVDQQPPVAYPKQQLSTCALW